MCKISTTTHHTVKLAHDTHYFSTTQNGPQTCLETKLGEKNVLDDVQRITSIEGLPLKVFQLDGIIWPSTPLHITPPQ